MPEKMGFKDWHCVTRGQIRDTEWSPLLRRVLPLEEMGFVFGAGRITSERAKGRRRKKNSLQIGPVLLKKGKKKIEKTFWGCYGNR